MPLPAVTLCPAGFVTTHPLDGRIVVEGWMFNPAPWDGSDPCHEPAYYWIASSEQEAAATVAEFVGNLAKPLTTT